MRGCDGEVDDGGFGVLFDIVYPAWPYLCIGQSTLERTDERLATYGSYELIEWHFVDSPRLRWCDGPVSTRLVTAEV